MTEEMVGTGADRATQELQESIDVHVALLASGAAAGVAAAAERMLASYRQRGKVLVIGNGGSAAQAEHLAAEPLGRYRRERRPLAAVALVENAPAMSAIANDYGYERSLARQITALAQPGDVVVALTTSGRSPNVIEALRCAREAECVTIVLCGEQARGAGEQADVCVCVPASSTPRIQEAHELMLHIMCELVEAGVCAEEA